MSLLLYVLDTNTVSHLMRQHARSRCRMLRVPMETLCISAVTDAELRFGLAKRPLAEQLHRAVHKFQLRVDSLPWHRQVALRYGTLRAELGQQGKPLSPLDLQIAAHASSIGAVLVTNDKAFAKVQGLSVEDWTQ